jgi:hypothetical protein
MGVLIMWAITPNGIGKPVTARAIEPDWDLVDGETLKVEVWERGMVLAEDGASLRLPTSEEIASLVPPVTVSPWQFRKALNHLGLRQQVEDAVSASTDQNLKDGWEFATEFRRNDALVVSMGYALGKTDSEMDQLFELAASL